MSAREPAAAIKYRRPPALRPTDRDMVAHACLALSLAVAAIPILATATPPLFDYPNHLARAHVIAHFDAIEAFRTHFAVASFVIPNVLADLVLLALIPAMGTAAAGKALLIGTFILTVGGAYALSRALTGQFSVWPLFAAALLYNEFFFWGFLNYNLGLALMLWGLAAWVGLEGRRRTQLAAAAALAVLIFLAHLVAFGLYGGAIGVLELLALRRLSLPPGGAALRLAGSASQAALPLIVFFGFSPSNGLHWDFGFDFSVPGKVMPLARVLSSNNPGIDLFTAVATGGFLLGALAARRVACHAGAALVAALFLVLVLTLPYKALGSFFLDSRVTVAVALIVVAGLYPRRTVSGGTAALVLMTILAARSAVLTEDWLTQQREYDRVIAALDRLPRGSMVITAVGHDFELGDWLATRRIKPSHEHTTLYATIRRDALVPNIFARRGQNPLVFRSPLEDMMEVVRNPVPRLLGAGDARWVIAQARAAEALSKRLRPMLPAVYVIAYAVPCSMWPEDLPIRRVRCDPAFSLVSLDPDGGRGMPER